MMREIPIEFCASIGATRRPFTQVPEDQQPWFSSSDTRGCKYDGVDWNALLPLDEELIESMRECEAMYMHMVARVEKARTISYSERKRTYLLHLQFWNDFIERNKINLFVSAWMPHEVPDHIIHFLCRLKGIPTLMFCVTPILNCEYLIRDWEESSVEVRDRYEQLLQEYRDADMHDVVLCKQFEQYFQEQSQLQGKKAYTWPDDPSPMTLFLRRCIRDPFGALGSVYRYVRILVSPRAWLRCVQKFLEKRKGAALHRYYCANVRKPDFSRRYLYAPLQLQPEATTCPMGGGFMDQELIMQMLGRYLPEDVLLYVKEHQLQQEWSQACRSINFYNDILSVRNASLIPMDTSTFDLREHCTAIVSGTGTAAFEAMFRGKPALMFGHHFYQYAPGVFPVHTAEDCKKALETIFGGGGKPTLKEVRIFMKAVEETTVFTALSDHHQRVCDLSSEEIAKNTADALVSAIKTLA